MSSGLEDHIAVVVVISTRASSHGMASSLGVGCMKIRVVYVGARPRCDMDNTLIPKESMN